MSVHLEGEIDITFLHIPKTGGSSVLNWLHNRNRPIQEYGHLDPHPEMSKLLENYRVIFSFACVRNPWERLVSFYGHLIRDREKLRRQEFLYNTNLIALNSNNGYFLKDFTFQDMVLDGHNLTNWNKSLLTPQTHWLDAPVDYVMRYETLQNDFRVIQSIFDDYSPLPFINTSQHQDYRSYYTDATRKIVAKAAESDIDTWHYTF